MVITDSGTPSTERRKEMYIKSTATGQVYKVEFIPKFGGYELASESDYLEWCRAHGIKNEG